MNRATNLYKAQMGGGTEQSDMYKQLTSAIYSAIKRGQSPNDVYAGLINQKINKDIASKLVSGVVEYMLSNGELEEEDLQLQNEKQAQEEQQRMQEQQMAQQDNIVDNWDESSYNQNDDYAQQMEDANQQSMDIVNQDSEDILGFQDGGEQAVLDQYDEVDTSKEPNEIIDYSKLVASTPGTQNVQFPGLEEYYYQYNPLITEDFQLNYNPSESGEEPQMAKFGGVKTKRKFTNRVLNLLKKQAGGEGMPKEDEVVDSAKAKQTDDLTNSVKKVKDQFINAIGGEAKKVAIGNWFEKLKENNDPMLDQILNPPSKENPLEQKMQQDQQMQQELSGDQMRKGGSNKKYNRLAKRIYNQMANSIPIPKGFSLPVSYYDKRSPFVNQRFSTIDVPQINKYFELLAKMYPKAKSAPAQAEEAVIKNNMVDDVVNNSGNTGIDANPIWAQLNNFNTPLNPYQTGGEYGQDMQMIGQYGGYTGSKDPSVPALTRFIQGGYDQFPEESKNVNDPYFSDMTPYPQMQNGGDPSEYTHYTHGENDVFHDDMNTIIQAQEGLEISNPYLQQLQQLLEQSKYKPRDVRKFLRNQRRINNSTYRDVLFPANRFFNYTGSWAQQMGLPFTASNGETYLGSVNGPIAKREVTKRGILGRPKEWTDYYMLGDDGKFSSLDPTKENKITLDPYRVSDNGGKKDRLDRRIARWDKRAARNEEEYVPMQGAITNYENPEDFYNAVNPLSKEDADFLGAGFTSSDEYVNKGKVKRVRDEEGNWYNREDKIIPDKKSPSEVPGYYHNENILLKNKNNFKEKWLSPKLQKHFKDGGLKRAFAGLENTPVSYTNNPTLVGKSEVDLTANDIGNTALEPSSFWGDQQSFNAPPPSAPQDMQQQNEDLTKYTVDPNQIEEYQAPKEFRGLVGVKRKRKDMYSIDPEAGVNTFNAGVKGALGVIDRRKAKKQEAQMYAQNFDPTQIYGKKERMDKGDWDVNTGMYRTNETGANRLGRSKKFGGYMQPGGETTHTPIDPRYLEKYPDFQPFIQNEPEVKLQPRHRKTFFEKAEEKINDWLGNPQDEASKFSRDRDNIRHPYASYLTSKKVGPFLGNTLGAAHELRVFANDSRPWSEKVPEMGEDLFNNWVGSKLSILPDSWAKGIIGTMSDNNLLPDGVNRPKGVPDSYVKRNGGYMQEGGVSEEMFYPQDNMIYPPGDSEYPMVPLNQDIMDMLYNQYYSNPYFVPYIEDPYIEEAPEQADYRMVKEGGETYMSEKQINAFLAAGGEIEYL